MKLWAAGEGPTDIGSLALDRMNEREFPGVLQALVALSGADAEFIGGDKWCSIPKLRVGSRGKDAEAHTVRALRLRAKENGADALAFIRDRDGSMEREAQIESALAEEGFPAAGVAVVERLEHWLLAVAGSGRRIRCRRSGRRRPLQRRASAVKSGHRST